ncbi:hypothetical protein PICSAR120_04299 [Mycobacterium avium subsp. paratuberculosis]|nr:hypothetical protein PICSAR120_04299 [Mycobacterium avium subsp. paratuberculosis]CAG6934336.1 hypothetical protein PICSAR107_04322 [Mycobacterium avium subsp. paratuberculosis]CAG6982483.1 hypothetical protein PICSAR164_01846 [Mycobacterium avium subsp. paratuberculosis]CAG6987631.1 hypothetical protein PICSAR14_02625 [Mycobacterium avium subsp. paratuberculosis]CAG7206492.1 hypothetical protein PICSAR235_04253 [Mycobacterium avium subsp. paratuberculosis]
MLSGAGAGNGPPGWAPVAATSTTGRPKASSRARRSAVLTATTGAASPSMNSMRVAGSAGSIGR